jgi:hypothetical protein
LAFFTGKAPVKPSSFLLPFSPSIDRWTEDHYAVYSLVELTLGNRKEVTKQEREEIKVAEEVDALIESGDPNWLQKVEEYFNEGYNIDEIPIDQNFIDEIEREESSR